MNLHEYQAKHLFAAYGMPVPKNCVVSAAGDVPAVLASLGGERWAVKAQVHAGGRGKAGGVTKLIGTDLALVCVPNDLTTVSVLWNLDDRTTRNQRHHERQ